MDEAVITKEGVLFQKIKSFNSVTGACRTALHIDLSAHGLSDTIHNLHRLATYIHSTISNYITIYYRKKRCAETDFKK